MNATYFSPNSVSHWGVLTVRVKPLRSRCFFFVLLVFYCAGPQKTRLRRSKFAFRLRETVARIFFLRLAVAPWRFCSSGSDSSWIHFIWTEDASPEVKICVSPARNAPTDLGRTVFPAQGHTKRISGGQNLRFACAGAENRMLRMLRHESETWILQSFLRYIWMLRHGSGDMDLAEDPEIQRCWDMNAKTWIGHMDLAEDLEIRRCWDMNPTTWPYIRIQRHGSCRGSWDTYGCWDMIPKTWILQRILRYIWMLLYGSGDMDLAEEPEIQRCWDMSPKTWIL